MPLVSIGFSTGSGTDWLGSDTAKAIGADVEVVWVSAEENDGDNGIVAVHLSTPSGIVRLD